MSGRECIAEERCCKGYEERSETIGKEIKKCEEKQGEEEEN